MCKHVAAVLYGIGARLDQHPELLFTLRKVDHQDLIAKAGSDLSKRRKGPAGTKVLKSENLSEMFGIEMAPATRPKRAAASKVAPKPSTAAAARSTAPPAKPPKLKTPAKPPKQKKPAPKRRARTPRLTPEQRRVTSS